MKEYIISRCVGDPDWNRVPALQMQEFLFPSKSDVTAKAQVCYDAEAIYVRLEATESQIRASHTGPLDEICEDSCLEFFISPMADGRYFNIEVNPNGAIYLGFGTGLHNLQRLIGEQPAITPKTHRTDTGWVAEYAIPVSFLQLFFPDFTPAPGNFIRANCFKCGDLTPIPHWLCWNKIPEEVATFHCPQHFGTMYFG